VKSLHYFLPFPLLCLKVNCLVGEVSRLAAVFGAFGWAIHTPQHLVGLITIGFVSVPFRAEDPSLPVSTAAGAAPAAAALPFPYPLASIGLSALCAPPFSEDLGCLSQWPRRQGQGMERRSLLRGNRVIKVFSFVPMFRGSR
jgi:hypothetical protein